MTSDVALIEEFVVYLRVERNSSPHTVTAYRSDLYQFSEQLQKKHVTLITADLSHVRAFLLHLNQHGREARTTARKIAALKCFYRWLILNDRLQVDPMRHTTAPKQSRLLPHPVEPTHLARMMQTSAVAATSDGADAFALRDHALLELLFGAGVRVSELCALDVAGIMLTAGITRVMGKGRKERIVPIGDGAVAAVGNYLSHGRPQLARLSGKRRPDVRGALFLGEGATRLTRQRVYAIIRRKGGDQKVSPHSLRHSCATEMLSRGADLRQVQEQLGHTTIATTQIYTGVTPTQLQDAHAKFHPRGSVRGAA